MEKITTFIGSHYGWFLTISLLLLFALIGYIVDTRREKSGFKRTDSDDIDSEYIKHLSVSGDAKTEEKVNNDPNTNIVNNTENTKVETAEVKEEVSVPTETLPNTEETPNMNTTE